MNKKNIIIMTLALILGLTVAAYFIQDRFRTGHSTGQLYTLKIEKRNETITLKKISEAVNTINQTESQQLILDLIISQATYTEELPENLKPYQKARQYDEGYRYNDLARFIMIKHHEIFLFKTIERLRELANDTIVLDINQKHAWEKPNGDSILQYSSILYSIIANNHYKDFDKNNKNERIVIRVASGKITKRGFMSTSRSTSSRQFGTYPANIVGIPSQPPLPNNKLRRIELSKENIFNILDSMEKFFNQKYDIRSKVE